MTNNQIQNELQKIKGIGPWTSEMFLIFCLYRKDVISFGDIAIRRGLESLYKLDHDITKKEFQYYKTLFNPHQTIASFYLWEITVRNLFKELK
jgi:3-methyladenine DNA glycosylase/8-oxoguanine DNA glycosylase